MISIGKIAAGGTEYYHADNYYTRDEGTEQSSWQGQGAAQLGLVGKVEAEAFDRVLAGNLPDGSELTAARGERRLGLDVTISVPKSVSLVALLGGDKRVVDAVRQSASATLAWAERNLAEAKVWNGERQVKEQTGNLVAATFLHDINRNGDPQLHHHMVIANATYASDSKWHALVNDNFYNSQHALGAVHNAELRSRLEELGYTTVPAQNARDGSFEIKGVSREAVEAFSTRSAEIVETMEKDGRSSPRERELVTLATRKDKDPSISSEARRNEWKERAASLGLDLNPIVEAARNRSERGETVWTRVVEGVRGIGNKGLAIAAAMGLTAKDRDELVPERKGALGPKEFAAAQAVASAVRELGEHEAGFDRLDLVRAALERRGPLTASTIEARIETLQARGLLIGETRMMTTPSMLTMERQAAREVAKGNDCVAPVLQKMKAAVRLQQEARTLGLRRLNVGQHGAGIDMLSSRSRVHFVQGGAGVGKSAALMPVATIAKTEGHTVHAYAIAARTAREFGGKVGAEGKTIASLLARHRHVLGGSATPEQLETAQNELGGSVMMVDEASLVGTEQFEKIVRLANMAGAARLVFAGDKGQLQAIAAGKPFEQSQRERGASTSLVTENLRAESKQMKGVVAALERKDVRGAFAALKDRTVEVERGKGAELAAKIWASKTPEAREQTLLLTAGRAMRAAANAMVQRELARKGEIGGKRVELTVLDRVTISREGARQMRAYRDGRVVEFNSNLKVQGIARGERGLVTDVDDRRVMLRMGDGRMQTFEPHRLARNMAHDAVSVFEEKRIGLHEGDRIRWTQNDPKRDRGLSNGDLARVEAVGRNGITISTRDGELLDLKNGDPMLEKLDLAYAVNTHIAQGMTSKDGILVLSDRETKLNTTRSFLVAATRISGEATLIVDDAKRIERGIARNPGDKVSARDVAGDTMKHPEMSADEKRLAARLGPRFVEALFANKERELELERVRGRDGRGASGPQIEMERGQERSR